MQFEYKNKILDLKDIQDLTFFVGFNQIIYEDLYHHLNMLNIKIRPISEKNLPYKNQNPDDFYSNTRQEIKAFLSILNEREDDVYKIKYLIQTYQHLYKIVANFIDLTYEDGAWARTFLINNPEYQLTPMQQKRLFEFIIPFQSKAKIILVTNSEHILHSARYSVYKKLVNHNDIIIFNQADVDNSIQKISIEPNGGYSEYKGRVINYPSGFFDSSHNEIIQMG